MEPQKRPTGSRFEWERWHTLDDAADGLADRLAESELPLAEQVVLIPDDAAVRRTLKRAFELRGIPLADTRDPNRLRWDEALKWALLPLEVVARGFERAKVVAYLRTWQYQPEFPAWVTEISARGIRRDFPPTRAGSFDRSCAPERARNRARRSKKRRRSGRGPSSIAARGGGGRDRSGLDREVSGRALDAARP